ncbi:MAG: carboxypeptidase-like regulatory domain-containing protein, partial [bacterium]
MNGQIIDEASKQGIAFANIYVKDKGFGVISNGEGAFLLNYKGIVTNDTLVISCLGYFEKRISISKVLADKQNKLSLVPQFY